LLIICLFLCLVQFSSLFLIFKLHFKLKSNFLGLLPSCILLSLDFTQILLPLFLQLPTQPLFLLPLLIKSILTLLFKLSYHIFFLFTYHFKMVNPSLILYFLLGQHVLPSLLKLLHHLSLVFQSFLF
jgi:hypothetical protein